MSCRVSEVRQAVSAQIATLTGFNELRLPPEYFGRSQNTIAHLGYVVAVESSTASNERQRRTVGTMMDTQVKVTFSYRLRPKSAYPTDYDNALQKEEDVIIACLSNYATIFDTPPEFQIRYVSSTRRATNSTEWLIIDIFFNALHTITPTI